MSQETREPRTRETLEVTVSARPGFPEPAGPHGRRNDASHKAFWRGRDLAKEGATLLIHFREGAHGPVFLLEFADAQHEIGTASWRIELDPNPGPPPQPVGPVSLTLTFEKKDQHAVHQGT